MIYMICPKCNNSIGDSECICGNCGYNVRDDVDVALMQCISISGKDIYNNSNKFNALIADLLPKNEKERNALSNALKANVSIYIFNHNNASVDEIISNTLGEVCELTFTEPAWARYAIIKLSKAMGIFIPEEYDSTLDFFLSKMRDQNRYNGIIKKKSIQNLKNTPHQNWNLC